MVFISRLKLRNFKSFKAADIQLPKTFISFAGPNGSGKSNLCDAIRFAMGETSLRSLRAKKVKDLIFTGAKSAEVTIVFSGENGGEGYDIKRAIREDGKIRYRLNGKRTTRNSILETLKKHNLDESGRNTIAQGEVQRIISMNGKERRQIIDSVAGIADFEAKKKEALGELQTVEDRIKEARLVIGERKAFLDELGREKEIAIKYMDSKKTLTNAKGTLLRSELEKLERDLAEALKNESKILALKDAKDNEMAEIESQISQVDLKRSQTSEQMQAKQKTNALIRRLEELKASIGSRKQFIADREISLEKSAEERGALGKEIEKEKEAIARLEEGLASLRAELREAEKELEAAGGFIEDETLSGVRRTLEALEKELSSAKERHALLGSEIKAKKELIEAKREEEKGILPKGANDEGAEDTARLKRDVERLAKEIDDSFGRTKEINGQMSELDKQMLELKEKASIFRVRSSPALANPALSFIAELKAKSNGIYGTVADLISFDAKYANAVEAAGGARLLYVVVDCVDTATEVIEKLKKAKAGRATFIPLDSIRIGQMAKSGSYSSIIEAIDCKAEAKRAVEYVFNDTLLVDTPADAKKLGIGTGRMVTLDGEIFERSGIVSGGRNQGSVLNANQMRKIEDELNDVKASKDAMLQELYSIREEESRLRAEKSQIEIRIKTIEMKEKMDEERRKENEAQQKRKEVLQEEIRRLEESVSFRSGEREKLASDLAGMEEKTAHMRTKLKIAEEESRKKTEESSKKRADLSASVSSIKAKIEGRLSEIGLRVKECTGREERLSRMSADDLESHSRIAQAKKQATDEAKELQELETRISSASKEIEALFEQMRSYEEELTGFGKKRGAARIELDKFSKDMTALEVKKATLSTRMEDVKAEFDGYSGFEELAGVKKDELLRMIKESETAIASIPNVNMAAIEMYDRKKAEIEDVESKMGRLDVEREAIMGMISEIDQHKKDAFMETFDAVSANFSNMFKYINVGQGHLYLSDPTSPFESGLFIKLRRSNHEHSLDALSGGEKTLVAMMFIFALQFFKPAPFYILDEVDAALDKPNSRNLADLVAKMSADSQFIVVTHNDTVMSNSDSVIGVTKADNVSRLVGIKLKQAVAQA